MFKWSKCTISRKQQTPFEIDRSKTAQMLEQRQQKAGKVSCTNKQELEEHFTTS